MYITAAPPVGGGRPSAVKDYESDSDDNESAGFKGYASRARGTDQEYSKTDTLLSSDFKYTETKV